MPKREVNGRERDSNLPAIIEPPRKSNRGGKRPGAGNHHRIAAGVRSLKNEVMTLRAKYKVMPLDYMLNVLNDDNEDDDRRMWAAQTSAPYLHHKLASIEIVQGDQPVQHAVDLTKLSTKELDQLETLVTKASNNPVTTTLDETQYHEID